MEVPWGHFLKSSFPHFSVSRSNIEVSLKVVRNSFPFSIPAELYERLTRL